MSRIEMCHRVEEPHDAHGDCPGRPPFEMRLTPEQVLGLLRTLPDEAALPRLSNLLTSVDEANRCFIERHVDHLERLHPLSGRIADISGWVDASYSDGLPEELRLRRRVDKVCEEAGEVISALNGMYAENPRKGRTNGPGKVVDELLDTATAALGAVCHMTERDPIVALAAHIEHVWHRAGLDGREAPDGVAE